MTNTPIAAKLATELRDLIKHYVRLLEIGRDRIVELGGDCDPVDVMERSDPHLTVARRALAEYDTAKDSPAGEPVAWMQVDGRSVTKSKIFDSDVPLYTQPAQEK